MANVLSYPCPHCGAQLDAEKVGTWKPFNCDHCSQTVEPGMFKCPTCQKPLLVIRQKRQLVRYCESCEFTEVKQGLSPIDSSQSPDKSLPDSTPDDVVIIENVSGDAKQCKQCGSWIKVEAKYCPRCGHKQPAE